MTTRATVPVIGQDDEVQMGELATKYSEGGEEEGVGVIYGGDGGSRSSCSDTPPSISPSSSMLPPIAISNEVDGSVSNCSSELGRLNRVESLLQPTTMSSENPPLTQLSTETIPSNSTTQMLEARIVQLEQTLRVLVTTLQEQNLQRNEQNQLPQQYQETSRGGSKQQQPGHSREGSETTHTTGGSGATRSSSSSSPPTPNSPWLDTALSQWPPSNNHCLLESPDHVAHTLTRRINHQRRSRRRLSRQQIQEEHEHRNHKLHHRKRKGKTMSMVLLDIDPDENRGPRYVIPFTSSDLDVCCSDEITDGDSNTSGRNEKSAGEGEQDEVEDIVVPGEGYDRGVGNGREQNAGTMNLTCQGYSDAHWEALRARREAGRSDRRAYSYNDREFRNDSVSLPKQLPWRPALNAITKDHNSATSAEVTFEENFPQKLQEDIGIIMPHLRCPDVSMACSQGKNLQVPQDQLVVIDTKHDEEGMQSAVDCDISVTRDKIIDRFSSCNSNTSSDSAHTAKVVNTNNETSSHSSPNTSGKDRSLSVASTKSDSGNCTHPQSAETTGDAATLTMSTIITPKSQKSHRSGSPHALLFRDSTTLAESSIKSNQTMKEYVMNDLLNIDSRNQDGSATEDVDANMEEFLRIPPKLEYLMFFSLAVCMDSFLYVWTMLPLKLVWCVVCLACSICSPKNGVRGVRFHRRHLYPLMQSIFIIVVYSQVLCPISIGKLYHWIRGQAMLKLYVLIAIVEVFDRLLCSFGQDAWDSLYWNTTRRPRHPRTVVSIIVVGVYVTIHSLFLFVHVATLSVAVNSADNALLTLLISGNFAEIKSTVFKKYNKHHLFKITTSDICERFKLGLFLLLILFLNRFQGEMTTSMVKDYYSMCGIVFIAELISDWIKHSFITKFNLIKSFVYFDYALVLSGDVTGIGHEGLHLDYTHAAVKRLGLAQIPLVCVTARYLHEAVRYAIVFQGNGDIDHPLAALAILVADGSRWKFFKIVIQGMFCLVLIKILLGMCIRHVARGYLGVANNIELKGDLSARKSSTIKMIKDSDTKKSQ